MEFSSAQKSEAYYGKILRLFKKYHSVKSELKKLSESGKKGGKKKTNESHPTEENVKITLKFETIWDLRAAQEYLELVFE
jgi:hypothetical protein